MNRVFASSLRTAARQSAAQRQLAQGSRSYATGPSAAGSSNVAAYFLAAGVASAGGYYYLTRQSPQTLHKAEDKAKELQHRAEDKARELQHKGAELLGSAGAKAGVASHAAQSTGGAEAAAKGALDPSKFVTFKLKEVLPYNHNTARFVFELPDADAVSGLTIASALLIKPAKDGEGLDPKNNKPAIRPYTPITHPNEKGHIDFLIKKYPNGVLTNYIHNLKPGDELSFKGPLPKHPWKANEFEQVGLVAGGTGITPMYQLIQAIDSNPEDRTKVTLVFANVTEKDILIKEELDRLARDKPDQFKIHHVIEKPQSSWKGFKGFVGHDELAKTLPMPGFGDKIKIFVCGPPPMVEVISGNKVSPKDQGPLKGFLADIGYSPSQVYKF